MEGSPPHVSDLALPDFALSLTFAPSQFPPRSFRAAGVGSGVRVWLVTGGLLAAAMLTGCRMMGGPPERWVIFVSGDSRGYLEPCGCRRDQAGGLPGRATVIEGSKVPDRLVLDAGNLTPGGRPYELLKLRYLMQGMEKIGCDAVNLGKQEAELDLDTLQAAMNCSRLPFVSANLVRKSDHQRLAAPYRILRRGALRVGVTGVTAAA